MTAQDRALKILKKGRYNPAEFGQEMWPNYASLYTEQLVAKQASGFLAILCRKGLVSKERGKYHAV